jgi:hypothetical protein
MQDFSNLNIINNLDTQVRYLPILKQILQTIGNNSTSIKLLEQKLQNWSLDKLQKSEFYRNHNGILTHKDTLKSTTAFKYYIDFLVELKLITKLNDFIRCSKYGLLFETINSEINAESDFADFEKLFYLIFLFTYDTDNLLLILDYISEQTQPVAQAEISKKYKNLLKIRLEHKFHISENQEIRNKYLNLLQQKKEAKTPAKHIIPPRIEWLTDLGIIEETKKDVFQLSKEGADFYKSIPKHDLIISKISIINNEWYFNNSITDYSKLFDTKILFKNLNNETRINLLQKYLNLCFEKLNTDYVSRISTFPAFILLAIMLFIQEKIIINFSEIKEILLNGFETENKIYFLRDAFRINESYIFIKIK